MVLGSVNTNYDVVAATPNEANQGARREVWWFQMNAEQQPSGLIWSAARRDWPFFRPSALSQAYVQQSTLRLQSLAGTKKMAESTPAELVLTDPKA